MNWLFWRVQWIVQMVTCCPHYELFPNNFLQESKRFVSWVCKKAYCQTMWGLGLEWIILELKINLQHDMWMFLLPSHKHLQNLAITIVLWAIYLYLWASMNYKQNETHTHKKLLSAFSNSLFKWMFRLTVAQQLPRTAWSWVSLLWTHLWNFHWLAEFVAYSFQQG